MRTACFRYRFPSRIRPNALQRTRCTHIVIKSSPRESLNPDWIENIYRNPRFTAPEYQGPVQIVELPGRGRGVAAAADLQPGQLVLVSKPFAYVTCPFGDIPSPDELASEIRATNYEPEELRSLNSLFSGVDSEDSDVEDDMEMDDLKLYGIIGCNSFGEEFADFPTVMTRAAGAAAAAPPGGAGCATDAAPVGQVGHLGLFPSFSMLNHSCLPNAVNFVVGDRMIVMASRSIRQGSEVLINYLGRASLRPVDERQAQLAEGYQFSCDCPRCRTELLYSCTSSGEELAGPAGSSCSMADGLQDILARCDERSAELDELGREAAAAAADGACGGTGGRGGDSPANTTTAAALGDLLGRVRQDVRHLNELVKRAPSSSPDSTPVEVGAGPDTAAAPPPRQQWLLASAFDLYSQHAALAEALGRRDEAAEAVGRQVAVCEAVAPGSDLHMYLAVKRALLAEQLAEQAGAGTEGRGAAAVEAAAAWRSCVEVLRGRYGAGLSEETVAALMRGAVYGLSQVRV